MIIDSLNELSNAQAITDSAASTNVYDLGIGGSIVGKPFYLIIECREDAEASGSATVTFNLQTSDTEDFASYESLWLSQAIGKADLTNGSRVARVGVNGKDIKQYVRVYYEVASGPLTAGKFDARLMFDA